MKTCFTHVKKPQKKSPLGASTISDHEIISLEESKACLEGFKLSDERILEVRNNMVGIVNNILNTYIESFHQ